MDEKYLIESLSQRFAEDVSSAQFASQTHPIEAMTNLLADYERKLTFRKNKPSNGMSTESGQNPSTNYPQNTRNDVGRKGDNEVNP